MRDNTEMLQKKKLIFLKAFVACIRVVQMQCFVIFQQGCCLQRNTQNSNYYAL